MTKWVVGDVAERNGFEFRIASINKAGSLYDETGHIFSPDGCNRVSRRRNNLDLNTPVETAIRRAINAVEAAGADPHLTQAVLALMTAFELVADWQDEQGAVVSPEPSGALRQDMNEAVAMFDRNNVPYEPPFRVEENHRVPKVVPLSKPETAGAIKTLENFLDIAKTRGLTGVGVVAVDMEGNTSSAYEQGHNIALLLGAINVLQSRLIRHYEAR